MSSRFFYPSPFSLQEQAVPLCNKCGKQQNGMLFGAHLCAASHDCVVHSLVFTGPGCIWEVKHLGLQGRDVGMEPAQTPQQNMAWYVADVASAFGCCKDAAAAIQHSYSSCTGIVV